MRNLKFEKFENIDLDDVFFDSLKVDYKEFSAWFEKKSLAGSEAYISQKVSKELNGFLYMKIEDSIDKTIHPPLPLGKTIKLGTLKIDARGTKLGERFIKKVFDYALHEKAKYVFVTIFQKHLKLIDLLNRYGFEPHGLKISQNGDEIVLLKEMSKISGDTNKDFPNFSLQDKKYYLLAIYPQYHSSFLPDSILNNENHNILEDISHTNSIHKAYISGIARTSRLKNGDILVIYRTSDGKGKAFYRSVATSIVVVEEVRRISSFRSQNEFLNYAKPYSIFSKDELKSYFTNHANRYIIRFTYNAALAKRLIRGRLINECNISTRTRWDFIPLNKEQLEWIASEGKISESIIVN